VDKIIAAIRFKELDTSVASDIDILTNYNKQKSEARHHIVSMILSVGGREIGDHESDLIVEIPLDSANILRDAHARLEHELEISTTIGVGDDLKYAKMALDWAVENRPGTIKVMEPVIEKEAKKLDDKDDFDHLMPEDVAIDQEGRPEQHINKAEGDTDDWANDKESISDEMRAKIVNIVKMLQGNKERLNSLRETSPEVYAGVVGLVNSISAMAQSAKVEDAKAHSKMITKVSKYLDQSEEKNLDDQAASVMEMLIEAMKEKEEEHKAEMQTMHQGAERRFKVRRKLAIDHANKTGSDPKFLLNLNRTMRR